MVIDAFRLIETKTMCHEPRQFTSNLGHLQTPSIKALVHGLNKHCYSISIKIRMDEKEQQILLNFYKKIWLEGLKLQVILISIFFSSDER